MLNYLPNTFDSIIFSFNCITSNVRVRNWRSFPIIGVSRRQSFSKTGKDLMRRSNMAKLPTWDGRSSFSYTGSVQIGTAITYGSAFHIYVSAEDYQQLLNHFGGRRVRCGTSRTNPPPGSLGDWLIRNITKTAIASYVGAILVHEGYAIKEGPDVLFH